MVRAIRDFYERTGEKVFTQASPLLRPKLKLVFFKVGFKPAGGISSAKDAVVWLSMMQEELGYSASCPLDIRSCGFDFCRLDFRAEWTQPNLFRIGASSLLLDVERQLEHGLTGNYSATYMLAMS